MGDAVNLGVAGLTGPTLKFKNAVERAFESLISVRVQRVDATANLPDPAAWDGRMIHVRSYGTVISDQGAWVRTSDGSAV